MSESLQPLLPITEDEKRQIGSSSRNKRSWISKETILPWLLLFLTIGYCNRDKWTYLTSGNHAHDSVIQEDSDPGRCRSTGVMPVKAPRRNVWKNLDIQEAADIRRWLFDSERGLNLTHTRNAYDNDNVIHYVETYRPSKNTTLAYLSDESVQVPRYAHAIVHNATTETIIDYLIGPLPISPSTTLRPITENYQNPIIPLNAKSTFNWTLLGQFTKKAFSELTDITQDVFGGSVDDGQLAVAGAGPMSYDGSWRRSWVELRHNRPGAWILPLDFYLYIDMSGTDPSLYKILSIVHNDKIYENTTALRTAWVKGDLKRTSLDKDTSWGTRKIRGKILDLDDRAGPRQMNFDGIRYRLDLKEDYLTWMGWSFYMNFERDMGLRFYDIHFRGERIIYELSPQEALAQYSGSNPHQATTAWLDRAFGMGETVRELIPGYDCPHGSTFLNGTVHSQGSTVRPNAICIFENAKSIPLSRHTGYEKDEMGAVKGYELVVRSISTVGNYDYIFDYTFMLDGTIEIRVSASGYLQGGAWSQVEAAYGHRIQRGSMGSLHDHVINFKVDFDILGTKNSMTAVSLEVEEKEAPWLSGDWGNKLVQQKIVRRPVKVESKLEYPANYEGSYVITNEDHKNSWGNTRGYVIHPGPLCKLTNINSKRTEKNVDWAKHHLSVTKRQDYEPESSSPWNMNLPGRPPVDFAQFFNDESIEQEDLVVWLNLGTHHIPRAEDSPNTLTNLATSYVLLAPHNFNDYDVSIDSRNSVLLNKGKREDGSSKWTVEESVKQPNCMPEPIGEIEYTGVVGYDEEGNKVDESSPFFQALQQPNSGLRAWE